MQKGGGKVTVESNTIDANYFKGVGSNQERTGVVVVEDMNIPMTIHKDIGPGSSSNLGIESINNGTANCLCARDYKGVSRKGANAVIVMDDFELIDGYNKKYIDTNNTGTLCCKGNTNSTSAGTFLIKTEPNGINLDADGESVRGLKAQYQKNSASNFCRSGSYGATAVMEQGLSINNQSIRIRKLTPCECFMLQGWTKEEFMRAKNAGVSDSQLYKQAGNGVSVNIAQVIGLRLAEIEEEEKGDVSNEESNLPI